MTMSIISDFVTATNDISDSTTLRAQFLAQMPKNSAGIAAFFQKNEGESECDFQKLITHIQEKIQKDSANKSQWEAFLSDIRNKILTIFFYSLSVTEEETFQKNMDVIVTTYEMSNMVNSESISSEWNSMIDDVKLLDVFMAKLTKLSNAELRREYLLKIWTNCIAPVQTLAIEGQLMLLVRQFMAKINPVDLFWLYKKDNSFQVVLNTPTFKEDKFISYYEGELYPSLLNLFLSVSIRSENLKTFFSLADDKICDAILEECCRIENGPREIYSPFLVFIPIRFFEKAWKIYDRTKSFFLIERAVKDISEYYNYLSFLLPFLKGIMAFEEHLLNRNPSVPIGKVASFFKTINPFIEKCFRFLADKLIEYKDSDFFELIKKLVQFMKKWEEVSKLFFNKDLIKQLNSQELLYSHYAWSWSENFLTDQIVKLFTTVIITYQKNNTVDECCDFIASFYDEASFNVQKVVFNVLGRYSPEKIMASEKGANFLVKILLNSEEEDLKYPFETYENKIRYIQMIEKSNFGNAFGRKGSFSEYLITQLLKKLQQDVMKSDSEDSAEVLADVNKFLQSNFFMQRIIDRLIMPEHKDIFAYIFKIQAAISKRYVFNRLVLDRDYVDDVEKDPSLPEYRSLFEINPEVFFDCWKALQDEHKKRRLWWLF